MTIKLQADADLNHIIVTATRQREPGIDFLSAADGGIVGVSDPEVLERAACDQRILITHDRRTMPKHFRARLESGKSSPGVLIVAQHAALGPVVDAIVLIWAASEPDGRDHWSYCCSGIRTICSRQSTTPSASTLTWRSATISTSRVNWSKARS